ncbi:hypothetical protein V8E51_013431 [Hyaloscypha variabilis]
MDRPTKRTKTFADDEDNENTMVPSPQQQEQPQSLFALEYEASQTLISYNHSRTSRIPPSPPPPQKPQSSFAFHYQASQPSYNHLQRQPPNYNSPYRAAHDQYGGQHQATRNVTAPRPLPQPPNTHSLLSGSRPSTHDQTPHSTFHYSQGEGSQQQAQQQVQAFTRPLQQNSIDPTEFNEIDRVVRSAIKKAFASDDAITALALNELWDPEHYVINPRIARLIRAIYSGQATEAQFLEFRNIMRHKKKESRATRQFMKDRVLAAEDSDTPLGSGGLLDQIIDRSIAKIADGRHTI